MATLTVRNIPDDLYIALKAMAQKNRRSLNNEIIHQMERALSLRSGNVGEVLESAQLVRETLGIYVANDEIVEAIDEGRP